MIYFESRECFDLSQLSFSCLIPNESKKSDLIILANKILTIRSDIVVLPEDGTSSPPKLWVVGPRLTVATAYKILSPWTEFEVEKTECLSQLHPGILEDAIKYSVNYRIAPLWNRVGKVFVEGRNFLNKRGDDCPSLRTVECRLEYSKTSSKIRLLIFPFEKRMILPEFKLFSFVNNERIITAFEEDLLDVIEPLHLETKEVYVLPNLTPAKVISITRNILASTEINDWKSMKKYWRERYGYRLSRFCNENDINDPDEPTYYVNVSFGTLNDMWCYPPQCVTFECPKFIDGQNNPDSLIKCFMAQFQSRFRTIFNQKIDMVVSENKKNTLYEEKSEIRTSKFIFKKNSMDKSRSIQNEDVKSEFVKRIEILDNKNTSYETLQLVNHGTNKEFNKNLKLKESTIKEKISSHNQANEEALFTIKSVEHQVGSNPCAPMDISKKNIKSDLHSNIEKVHANMTEESINKDNKLVKRNALGVKKQKNFLSKECDLPKTKSKKESLIGSGLKVKLSVRRCGLGMRNTLKRES